MNLLFMEEKMKVLVKKTAVSALAATLAAGMLSGCGQTTLDGTKTVATVNGTEVPLGVVSLLTRQQQAETEYMYASFLGGQEFSIWDTATADDADMTYGEQLVQNALEQVELMYIMKEKAADYGVEVTEEDQAAIAEAAAEFMEANDEETIRELGVNEDQVKELLELQTYLQRIYDPIIADVDTEVSQEEAQQSSFTYIAVDMASDDEEAADDSASDDEDAEAENTADDEDAEAENTADDEDAEAEGTADDEDADTEDAAAAEDADTEDAGGDEDTDAEDTETADPKEQAQEILDKVKDDPEADMQELADEVGEGFSAYSGTFATFESEDEEESTSVYPDEVLAVLRELNDGEAAEELVEANDKYYILRLDEKLDEDATESKKESIINTRESELYTETTENWLDEADIEVKEKVLATLKVTDMHSFTIQSQEEETIIDDDIEDAEVVDDDLSDAGEEIEEEPSESGEVIEEEPSESGEVIEEEPSESDEVIEDSTGSGTVDNTMEDPK